LVTQQALEYLARRAAGQFGEGFEERRALERGEVAAAVLQQATAAAGASRQFTSGELLPAEGGWARKASADEVMRLCGTAFYEHDVDMLGTAERFGVSYRIGRLGPVTFGDIIYGADVRLDFHELGTGYQVIIPVHGVVESRHRGRPHRT
jgi:hypothetical protein